MPEIVSRAVGDIRNRLWTLYWIARMYGAGTNIIELGVRGGDSTRALVSAANDAGSLVHSYDIEDCSAVNLGGNDCSCWSFRLKDSRTAALDWLGRQVEIVFVDTDHTFATTQNEIAAWAPLVRWRWEEWCRDKPLGCMVFHDYWLHDPGRDENEGRGVKMAVDHFANNNSENWKLETHNACEGDTGLAILWRIQ